MSLPPLPEMKVIDQHIPSGYCIRGYDSKQMTTYGQACWNAAIEAAAKKIAELIADHCDATGECAIDGLDCEYAYAWNDAIDLINGVKK